MHSQVYPISPGVVQDGAPVSHGLHGTIEAGQTELGTQVKRARRIPVGSRTSLLLRERVAKWLSRLEVSHGRRCPLVEP